MGGKLVRGRVRKARVDDLECIRDWVFEQGYFDCNWDLTLKQFEEGHLIVFAESTTSEPVAYQWGTMVNPGILEVREDKLRQGIGKRLVEYRIEQASRKNICALRIQCRPSTSIPFWEHMGFQIYDARYNHAFLYIEKEFDLPETGTDVDVTVSAYPNKREWYDDIAPAVTHHFVGRMTTDGQIHFPKRVCIGNFWELWNGHPVIGIEVDGNTLFLDPASYPHAESIGIQQFINGYVIDRIAIR